MFMLQDEVKVQEHALNFKHFLAHEVQVLALSGNLEQNQLIRIYVP
jgi:hypothetical protein